MPTKSLFLICISLCFSSCFEFIEEVNFTSNQKGNCLLTLNCSQSKSKLSAILKLDTFLGYNIPRREKVESDIVVAASLLNSLNGISNVHTTKDFENFIFSVKFDFDSVKNLNAALNALAAIESQNHPLPFYTVYEFNGQSFTRNKVPNDSMAIKIVQSGNLGLISGATATSIYRFNTVVEKNSNSKALISKSKTAVMLKQNIIDIIKQPSLFSNTIQLK